MLQRVVQAVNENAADFQFLRAFPRKNRGNVGGSGKTTFAEMKALPSGMCRIFPKSEKERTIMKNNNQINIPQAREAMDKFKMQAASEEDVFSTS